MGKLQDIKKVHAILKALLKEVTQVQYLEAFEAREDRYIKVFAPIVKKYFRQQRKELLQRFDDVIEPALQESLQGLLVETTIRSQWLELWNEVVEVTANIIVEPLTELGERIYIEEYTSLLAFLGFEDESPISFDIVNRKAVAFYNPNKLISEISDTTQTQIRDIVNNAVEEGLSYNQLSRQISTLFTQFNTKKDINGRSRADRIAINEIRERNSGAGDITANELLLEGFTVEKRWITRNDDKVRPEHEANEEQGYIPVDEVYQSGDERPPTDPNCRCVQTYRSSVS